MSDERLVVALAVVMTACASTPKQAPSAYWGGTHHAQYGQQVPTQAAPLMDLSLCVMDTGGSYLPDPCRMEVTPGEWLKVSSPKPEGVGDAAKPKKHKWWTVVLAALLI